MEHNHPLEKTVDSFVCQGVSYDVVERPDVLWVGCLDYAPDNSGESDSDATLSRFRDLLSVEKREPVNPAWSAAIWVNYGSADKPCGLMFAQETYSDRQDGRYEILKQPAGLWLKLRRDRKTSLALFGGESIDAWDYFACGKMTEAALANGYVPNPDVPMMIGYNCHEEYATPPYTCFAYLPVSKN